MVQRIQLLGRILISGDIEAATGLHIGGAPAGLAIGALDNPVIREPVTGRPYIPGSSLKGKMRSLSEKARGFNPGNKDEVQKIGQVRIHVCQTEAAYNECHVCQVFGVPGEIDYATPTRLTVRDVFLDEDSLAGAQLDFPFTEIKWEAAIDRVTSAALPRQLERVPAQAIFKPCELVLSLYDLGRDTRREFDHLRTLIQAMQLLEDDYLGGQGSRGSGKIRFWNLSVAARRDGETVAFEPVQAGVLADLVSQTDAAVDWARRTLTGG